MQWTQIAVCTGHLIIIALAETMLRFKSGEFSLLTFDEIVFCFVECLRIFSFICSVPFQIQYLKSEPVH